MFVQKTVEYRSLDVFQNRRSSCRCWPELLETTIYQCYKLAYANREPCRYCSVEARSAYSLQAQGRATKKKNVFRTICKHEDAARTFFIRRPQPLVRPRVPSLLLQSISQLALGTHTKLPLYLRRAACEDDTQIRLFLWTFWFMKMAKEMTPNIMIPMERYSQTITVSISYWSILVFFFRHKLSVDAHANCLALCYRL